MAFEKNDQKKSSLEIIQQFIASSSLEEEELIQSLIKLKQERLFIEVDQNQIYNWTKKYEENKKRINLTKPQPPNFELHLPLGGSSFVGGLLFILIGSMAALPAIGPGIFFAIVLIGLTVDYFWRSYTYDNEMVKYEDELAENEALHPNYMLEKKLVALIECYQKNKQYLWLDLRECAINTECLRVIESAINNNKLLVIKLPAYITDSFKNPTETKKLILKIKEKSNFNQFYNNLNVFSHTTNEQLPYGDKLGKDIYGLIFTMSTAVCQITDKELTKIQDIPTDCSTSEEDSETSTSYSYLPN